jgi:hypothetical protein
MSRLPMIRIAVTLSLQLSLSVLAGESQQQNLLAAYFPTPSGYPSGAEYAQPDLSVPYRWHYFREDAVASHADSKMTRFTGSYNPLEDSGVSSYNGATFSFVDEHVTEGKRR